jgi:hypothetical protein
MIKLGQNIVNGAKYSKWDIVRRDNPRKLSSNDLSLEVRPTVCKLTAECPQHVASSIRQGPGDRFNFQFTVGVSTNAASAERQIAPCCPEVTTRTKKSPPLSLRAFMTGASLIASGRVPTMISQRTADEPLRTFCICQFLWMLSLVERRLNLTSQFSIIFLIVKISRVLRKKGW